MYLPTLYKAHNKPGVNADEELELPEELENAPEDAEEEVEEEVEEVEEEVPATPAEEMVPLSRLRAESARADALVGVLEQFRNQQPQPQQARQAQVQEEDPYQNYTPEAKQWISFMAPVIQREARKIAQAELNQHIPNLQRETVLTRDMQDRASMLAQHRDFSLYEAEINEERAKWYQATGQMPPNREAFYYYVKGKRADAQQATKRTVETRKVAKPGATVSSKAPTRKVAPKGPLTLNDIANMDEAQLEAAMMKHGVTF